MGKHTTEYREIGTISFEFNKDVIEEIADTPVRGRRHDEIVSLGKRLYQRAIEHIVEAVGRTVERFEWIARIAILTGRTAAKAERRRQQQNQCHLVQRCW